MRLYFEIIDSSSAAIYKILPFLVTKNIGPILAYSLVHLRCIDEKVCIECENVQCVNLMLNKMLTNINFYIIL